MQSNIKERQKERGLSKIDNLKNKLLAFTMFKIKDFHKLNNTIIIHYFC